MIAPKAAQVKREQKVTEEKPKEKRII